MPSVRRRSGVVNTSSVGRFETKRRPQVVSSSRTATATREQPDGQIGSRPRKRTASKRRSSSWAARPGQHRHVPFQAADRVGLVEADRHPDRFPETCDVGLAEDLAGPPGCRESDHDHGAAPRSMAAHSTRRTSGRAEAETRLGSRPANRSGSGSPMTDEARRELDLLLGSAGSSTAAPSRLRPPERARPANDACRRLRSRRPPGGHPRRTRPPRSRGRAGRARLRRGGGRRAAQLDLSVRWISRRRRALRSGAAWPGRRRASRRPRRAPALARARGRACLTTDDHVLALGEIQIRRGAPASRTPRARRHAPPRTPARPRRARYFLESTDGRRDRFGADPGAAPRADERGRISARRHGSSPSRSPTTATSPT